MCSACVRSFLIERNRHNFRSRYKLYYFNAYNTRKLSYSKKVAIENTTLGASVRHRPKDKHV